MKICVYKGSQGDVEDREIGPVASKDALLQLMKTTLGELARTNKKADFKRTFIGLRLDEWPNQLWPTDKEELPVTDFKPIIESPEAIGRIPQANGANPFQTHKEMKKKINKFWKTHQDEFVNFWIKMARKSRKNFIKTIEPNMPESVNLLIPMQTVDFLVDDMNLVRFINHVNDFETLCGHYSMAIGSIKANPIKFDYNKKRRHDSGEEMIYHIFNDMTGEDTSYQLQFPKEDLQGGAITELEQKELAIFFEHERCCRGYEFELITFLATSGLNCIAHICDEYRLKVLENFAYDCSHTGMPCLQQERAI